MNYMYALMHVTKKSEEMIYVGWTKRHYRLRLREHFTYHDLREKLTRADIDSVNYVMIAPFETQEEAQDAETWLMNLGAGSKCNVQKMGWKPSEKFDPDNVHLTPLSKEALAKFKKRSNKWAPWDELTALTEKISAISHCNYTACAAPFGNLITSSVGIANLQYIIVQAQNQFLVALDSRNDDLYRRRRTKKRKKVYDRRCEEIMYTVLQRTVTDEMDKDMFMQYYGLGQNRIGSVASLARQYGLKGYEVQRRIKTSTQIMKEALEEELKGGKTA